MNKDVTVKVQRKIAKYVMGTHRNLLENHHDIGVRRRKIWRLWIDGKEGGNLFQKEDLPVIAAYFCDVWDAPIARGTLPKDITPTVLDLVKREIVELLVRMFIVPADRLECIMVRRSRRHSLVTDSRDKIVPAETSRKRKRRTS